MLGGSVFDQKRAMINLFDLMASTKVLTDRAHKDSSPVRRSRQDVKRAGDPVNVCVEDKLGASTRSSSSNKSNASPMKMLLAKEMSNEVEWKRKPPSVVVRLMGLEDDLPDHEPVLHSAKRNLRSHSHGNLTATNRPLQQQEQHHHSKTTRDIHIGPKETVEFKDVYEVCEDPFRKNHLQDQTFPTGRSSENKSDMRMEVVQQKFMEAKRLATSENLLHSKEFQEALEVLSSNRDLFLKFLEEPNSFFSKQLNGLHTMPAPPQTKRITVLKPIKSVENKGVRETRTHRISKQNELVMGKNHQRSHSAEDTFSQPTRIVVLKPSPGKPSRTYARLTPRADPSELTVRTDFYGGLEDDASTLGSREVLHGSVQHLPEGRHRRDESLLSSVYSNGCGGEESSFGRSEVDYIDEEGGSLGDSEVVSPVSRHSWDYIKRYTSPYSGSTFSRASHSCSPESSVIREAKKRLSERWAMVAYNEISQEQVELPRSSSTLGEMLSLQEAKQEEAVAGINSVSSGRSCATENELGRQATFMSTLREEDENGESSPRNLARSKSVPVLSSIFDDVAVSAHSANSEGCKTLKVVTRSGKGKLSFKGKVSSFFFPRSKKLTKEKTTLSSDSSDERVEVTSLGSMLSETDHNLGTDEQMEFCKVKADNSTTETIVSSKDIGSIEVPASSDCPSGYIGELRSNGGVKCIHDQPSPTSVLDASFEDSNSNEPDSSSSTTSCNERVALRSPAIESVARSLSWEDTNSRSPLAGSPKFSNVDDDDELECHALVQKIVSSAGLGNLQLSKVFTGWYLPGCPLDPVLCDKFLDRREEAAKSRERRSNQKILFDCVNMALVEIGQDALLSTYPWSKAGSGAWREKLCQALGEEVWSLVRDWLYGSGNFLANEDSAGAMLERIVQQEVEGRGWVKLVRSEADEITKQIASGVLEELVGDAVEDLAICFPKQGIPMPTPNL